VGSLFFDCRLSIFPTNEKFSKIPLVDPWQPRMVVLRAQSRQLIHQSVLTNLLSSLLVSATYLFSSNLREYGVYDGFQFIVDGTSRRKGKLLFFVDFCVKMCGSRVT
jgi:hypothetical protein